MADDKTGTPTMEPTSPVTDFSDESVASGSQAMRKKISFPDNRLYCEVSARSLRMSSSVYSIKFEGDPHMDQTRRAILNEFDNIQHAVLESPDHNTVHVIYSHDNEDIVQNKLSLELKTRTGLQLVPPQSAVTTSLAKDGVLVVIVSYCDTLTNTLLRKAVDTAGYPDTHTLLLLTEYRCPDWVKSKLPHCTLMIYPESGVERQSQFWETLTRMIRHPLMDQTHRAILNEFDIIQHAVLESPDHNTVHVIYSHDNETLYRTSCLWS